MRKLATLLIVGGILVGVIAVLATFLAPTAEGTARLVRDAGHPGVEAVFARDDWFDGPRVNILMHPTATEVDATAVWCDLLLPLDRPVEWSVTVTVEDDGFLGYWIPPSSCDTPSIQATLVSDLEYSELDSVPWHVRPEPDETGA